MAEPTHNQQQQQRHQPPPTPDLSLEGALIDPALHEEMEDAATGQKRKRKQLSSCDSCRHRRVRCLRDDASETCQSCRAKGIKCTSEYISTRPKINRSGKRIEHAKTQFGKEGPATLLLDEPSAGASTAANGAHINGSTSPIGSSSAGLSPVPPPPAGPSAPSFNTMIGMSETSASVDLDRGLSRHLVQEYFNCLHMAHPAINWNPFWDEAQSAGFDAMAMDTETGEVLCLTCQAFGARVSDHEQIIGPGVTRKSLQRGVDLSYYGEKREAYCRKLLNKAMKMLDVRGILRKVSVSSVSILLVLRMLYAQTYPEDYAQPAMLSAAALEQMRILVTQNSDAAVEIRGRPFWLCFVTDALSAAHEGRMLHVTTEDIQLFAPDVLKGVTESVKDLSSNEPAVVVRTAAFVLFGSITITARSIAEKITGPLAQRNRKLDANIVKDCWAKMDENARLCDFFQSRVEALFGTRAPTFTVWLKRLTCCRIELQLLIDRVLSQKIKQEQYERFDPDTAYIDELRELGSQSRERTFNCLRNLASIMRATSHFPAMTLSGALTKTFGPCIHLLMAFPGAEEGGPSDWPLIQKLADVETLLNALKLCGFSWSVAKEIQDAEAVVSKLRKGGATEAADILSHFASTPVSSEDPGPALAATSQVPSGFDDPFLFMQPPGQSASSFSFTEAGSLDLPPAGWDFLSTPQVFDQTTLSFFDTSKFG